MNDNYATDEQIMKCYSDWYDPCKLSDDKELRSFDGALGYHFH